MAKSRQEKLDELFLLFLEGNGIKERFFEEYKRQTYYPFNRNPLPANTNSINYAFRWEDSKEKYDFWNRYHYMWADVCKER